MKFNDDRLGHLRLKPNFFHMDVGVVLVTFILILHVQLVRVFTLLALTSILFFNLFFVFFLFPLDGPLTRKIILVIAGNLVGNLWHTIQLTFENTMLVLNANTLRVIVIVAKPLLDFVWIVVVWSFRLSLLFS